MTYYKRFTFVQEINHLRRAVALFGPQCIKPRHIVRLFLNHINPRLAFATIFVGALAAAHALTGAGSLPDAPPTTQAQQPAQRHSKCSVLFGHTVCDHSDAWYVHQQQKHQTHVLKPKRDTVIIRDMQGNLVHCPAGYQCDETLVPATAFSAE